MASGLTIGLSLLAGVAFGFRALVFLAALVILIRLVRPRGMQHFVVLVVVCLSLGAVRGEMRSGLVAGPLPPGSSGAMGVVTSLPVAGGDFERAVMRIERVEGATGEWLDTRGNVVLFLPDQHDGLSLHDRISVRWDAQPVAELAPGFGHWVQSQGAIGSAWVYSYDVEQDGPAVFEWLSDARRSVSRALVAHLPGDPGALASGFVTGDDSALSAATEEAFLRTGMSHLTSVSGQNIALLTAFVALWMKPRGVAWRIVMHASMLIMVWSYAAMVGLEPPALRAAVVASLTIIGAYSGRRPDPLTLLALTLGVMAIVEPRMTQGVGFWLSAAASLALCTVLLPEAPSGIARLVVHLLVASIAASLATLPILLWSFGEWSPVTSLANALLTPVMTVLFPVVYVFAGLAILPGRAASLVAWIPGIGLDTTLSIVHRIAGMVPQVYLDGSGAVGAVLIAIPCMAAIGLMSRDGERWIRVMARRA